MPIDLPNHNLTECWGELLDNVSSSGFNKGKAVNLSRVTDPIWKFNIRTGLLDLSTEKIWSSWKKSLNGGFTSFLAYDVKRQYLGGYPNATQPSDVYATWNGTAAVDDVGNSGQLTVSQLPANYQAKIGDRVALEQSGYIGYYEILEDATADGSGDLIVTVSPFLHTGVFDENAIARFWRPKCKLIIDWQSYVESGRQEPSPISFVGYQIL